MIYGKLDVDIIDHEKLLRAGAVARDLWVWGMLYSRKHLTDGFIPVEAIKKSPWGQGTARGNLKCATRLTEVGLWHAAESEGGFVMLRYAAKNETKAEVDAKRASDRDRKRSKTGACFSKNSAVQLPSSEELPRVASGIPPGIPGSRSGSPSGSVLDLEIACAREETPSPPASGVAKVVRLPEPCATPPALDEPLPARYRLIADGIAMNTGAELDVDAAWTRYVAWCVEAHRPISEARWQRWVSDDASKARERRQRRVASVRPQDIVQPPVKGSWTMPEDTPPELLDCEGLT